MGYGSFPILTAKLPNAKTVRSIGERANQSRFFIQ